MKVRPIFFVLEKPEVGTSKDRSAGTDIMPVSGFNVGEALQCPTCGRITSRLPWLPPYQVEIETWGKDFGTIAISGDNVIVSASFKQIYEEHKLKGLFEFAPVEVTKIKRHRKCVGQPPNYFKANIVRSQTTVDQVASGMEWAPSADTVKEVAAAAARRWGLGKLKCPVCLDREGVFLRQKRLVIEPETWTGEDIFHARGGARFVTSSRFKEVCEAHAVKNVVFVPAKSYEKDFYPSESKLLLKYLRMFEDPEQSRERRQDAYRTFATALGRGNVRELFKKDFDPDTEDPSVVEKIKKRLANEGLLDV